jgi:hypothetical protein
MKSKLVKESLNEMFTTQDGKSHRLKKGMVVRIMDEDDMIKKFRGGMHEDYLQYNLQIAGEVVEIKRAFSSHSKFGRGGGVDSFYVEGYEPYNLNSGFDDLIIAEVIEDPIRENLKEEMTPADRGMEAARRDNVNPGEALDEAFELAKAAFDMLNDISVTSFGDEIQEKIFSAETAVEELVDAIDAELRGTGYDRHR